MRWFEGFGEGAKRFCGLVVVPALCALAIFSLCGCHWGEKESSVVETVADGAAAGAVAMGIPWAAPILHGLGSALAGLLGTHGAAAATAVAAHHHAHFGVTPGRRRKLSGARDAHRSQIKVLKQKREAA